MKFDVTGAWECDVMGLSICLFIVRSLSQPQLRHRLPREGIPRLVTAFAAGQSGGALLAGHRVKPRRRLRRGHRRRVPPPTAARPRLGTKRLRRRADTGTRPVGAGARSTVSPADQGRVMLPSRARATRTAKRQSSRSHRWCGWAPATALWPIRPGPSARRDGSRQPTRRSQRLPPQPPTPPPARRLRDCC